MQSSKNLSKYLSSIFNYSLNKFTRTLRLFPAGHSQTQSLASVSKPTEEFKNPLLTFLVQKQLITVIVLSDRSNWWLSPDLLELSFTHSLCQYISPPKLKLPPIQCVHIEVGTEI